MRSVCEMAVRHAHRQRRSSEGPLTKAYWQRYVEEAERSEGPDGMQSESARRQTA